MNAYLRCLLHGLVHGSSLDIVLPLELLVLLADSLGHWKQLRGTTIVRAEFSKVICTSIEQVRWKNLQFLMWRLVWV